MSSREGPHAVGIGAPANASRAPTWRGENNPIAVRGAGVSSREGPHAVGIGAPANASRAPTRGGRKNPCVLEVLA